MNRTITFKIFDKRFTLSDGMYGMHRCDNEDKRKRVHQNYQAIRDALAVEHVLILNQVHGVSVVDADAIEDFSHEPEGDAAVSSTPGVAIAIQTADCVPILLASTDGKVVGGAHCGWRSAVGGVLNNVVELMRKKGAEQIEALLGPAIQQCSYEVDQSFYDLILAREPSAQILFIPTSDTHYLFDLPGFTVMQLEALGISAHTEYCEDTYSNPDKFYSYRRDTHRGITGNRTNILSTIAIKRG